MLLFQPKDRAKLQKEASPNFERQNSVTSDGSTEGDGEQENKALNNSLPPSTSPKTPQKQSAPGKKTSKQSSNKGQSPKPVTLPTNNAAMTTNKVFEGIGDDDL